MMHDGSYLHVITNVSQECIGNEIEIDIDPLPFMLYLKARDSIIHQKCLPDRGPSEGGGQLLVLALDKLDTSLQREFVNPTRNWWPCQCSSLPTPSSLIFLSVLKLLFPEFFCYTPMQCHCVNKNREKPYYELHDITILTE